jgi:hypothetical protein
MVCDKEWAQGASTWAYVLVEEELHAAGTTKDCLKS